MSVNWDNVQVPKPEDEEEEPKGPSILSTLFVILIVIAAIIGGAAFLNVTLMGTRLKERAIADCDGPACVLEVRTTHDDCFSDRMVFGMPESVEAFQTPKTSDRLGFVTVSYDDYAVCAGVKEAPK